MSASISSTLKKISLLFLHPLVQYVGIGKCEDRASYHDRIMRGCNYNRGRKAPVPRPPPRRSSRVELLLHGVTPTPGNNPQTLLSKVRHPQSRWRRDLAVSGQLILQVGDPTGAKSFSGAECLHPWSRSLRPLTATSLLAIPRLFRICFWYFGVRLKNGTRQFEKVAMKGNPMRVKPLKKDRDPISLQVAVRGRALGGAKRLPK